MKFRDNLVHLRAVSNMTQEQLAMLLGVSRQSVAKWEAGKSYPEMDKLIALCQIFDCTLDDLVQGDLTEREAGKAVPQVHSSAPTDVFGYDETIRKFTNRISNGVFAIMAGVAVSLFFFAFADDLDVGHIQNIYAALGCLCVFVGIGIGLALIIPAGMDHSAFVKEHPYIQDFYAPEQKEEAKSSFIYKLIGGICCIFAAVCLIIVLGDTSYVDMIGLPVMMALISIGVRFIIHGGMTLGRVDLDAYNSTSGECMTPEEINRTDLPESQKSRMISAYKSDKRIGAICGTIMMVATIAGLVMLLVPEYYNPLFWLAWPIGGLLCGIASTLIKGFSSER